MSVDKTASKNGKIDSYGKIKSPRNNYGSQQTVVERDTQTRLNQKIQKLKSALKASQHHNQQLHRKLKLYRMQSNDKIPYLQEQIKVQRKKLEMKQIEHREQINRIHQIHMKKQQQIRTLSAGKLTNVNQNQRKIKDFDIQLKSKDMKIVQLEGVIKDLKEQIQNKQKDIMQLHRQIQALKSQRGDDEGKKMSRLNDQLQVKAAECHQHHRQILKLKDSLKDSLKKIDKLNSQVSEQTQKNKSLQQQLKQSRKQSEILQKHTSTLRESESKSKSESVSQMSKVLQLDKRIIQLQVTLKNKQQKYEALCKTNEKQQQQFQSLLQEYRQLSSRNQEIVLSQYQLQRDFQRELHTIVKQVTRRHIVAKNLVAGIAGVGGSRAGLATEQRENRVEYKGGGGKADGRNL